MVEFITFLRENIGVLIFLVLLFIAFKVQKIYEIICEIGIYVGKISGKISRNDGYLPLLVGVCNPDFLFFYLSEMLFGKCEETTQVSAGGKTFRAGLQTQPSATVIANPRQRRGEAIPKP
ncbi:MAG: hypothetical protein PHO48_02710 [Candidatus Gracilibacteria bacterium]|nr:hypothetical protein [Candidatus Gracilibacteria bacterium]MDD5179095.1 hypothetical protein [Candidatus Gracilibacteria bacterium]